MAKNVNAKPKPNMSAAEFAQRWSRDCGEKQDTQHFWNDLLGTVFWVDNLPEFIQYEKPLPHTKGHGFIDAYIGRTKVLIEQKSSDVNLDKAEKQSDGVLLTPYQQARRYAAALLFGEHPRWIVVCNFHEFRIYDEASESDTPDIVYLKDLKTEYYRLAFLQDPDNTFTNKEKEISKDAGAKVNMLYKALLERYPREERDNPETLHILNRFCVRLVFCLYAEDAGIFAKNQLYDYLRELPAKKIKKALYDLFAILDTPKEQREVFDEELNAFPYVNGGLFAGNDAHIPDFDENLKRLLCSDLSYQFDWKDINPTIFGALFESTLNPETRRAGGMHYTSVENIHKVINPLFLDGLKADLNAVYNIPEPVAREQAARALLDKIAGMSFFDPACGSGNILTETYICLRRLENELLQILYGGQEQKKITFADIRVQISSFYGIEINSFAVSVAKTALWIAESQMWVKTGELIGEENMPPLLPLRTGANIKEANALRLDWNEVCPREKTPYIMGNPPFGGARIMAQGSNQKKDMELVFEGWKNIGNLDYVCAWFKHAADYIAGTSIRVAFVASNSVCQGDSVATLWKPLFAAGVHIDYAWRTFVWDSESTDKAHVYCVIVGFSVAPNKRNKVIYTTERVEAASGKKSATSTKRTKYTYVVQSQTAKNINAYLADAEDIFVKSRQAPLCAVPPIGIGNKPIDDGNYLFTESEKEAFIKKEPASAKYFKPWYGSEEFINNKRRYCLWLGDCPPNELVKMPHCLERVNAVRAFRLQSTSDGTVKLAEKPTRFHVENMPEGSYIVIPRVSSERRQYVPIGYLDSNALCSDATCILPNATLYHFGVLTSIVHNAWMRVVCGRLEMRYRYSIKIVYNNFIWPETNDKQQKTIEKTVQSILDARAKYPDSSFADMYGPNMHLFTDLVQAHEANDRAVIAAYGWPKGITEPEIFARLKDLYQQKTADTATASRRR